MKVWYDLHMHSCLSPCADDDMTPCNMAGMGMLKGLSVMALTDHNSCKNCPAFFKACEGYGILPLAGTELSTAEDIHMVSLFETLEEAMAFDEALDSHRMDLPNNPAIFGNQLIMGEDDRPSGTFGPLLIAATDLWMGDAAALVRSFGGVIYPAHIDRPANGIVSVLGDLPGGYGFTAVEFHDRDKIPLYRERYAEVEGKRLVVSSDAHTLGAISEAENFFELDLEEDAPPEELRRALFRFLRQDEKLPPLSRKI